MPKNSWRAQLLKHCNKNNKDSDQSLKEYMYKNNKKKEKKEERSEWLNDGQRRNYFDEPHKIKRNLDHALWIIIIIWLFSKNKDPRLAVKINSDFNMLVHSHNL